MIFWDQMTLCFGGLCSDGTGPLCKEKNPFATVIINQKNVFSNIISCSVFWLEIKTKLLQECVLHK